MSMRPVQEPVETEQEAHGRKETTITHPAFAQISASRVSGMSVLYGSDFMHRASIRIRIYESTLTRQLNSDWPFAGREMIEVELSEAQWATFVSSLNVGRGVQCTLRQVDGQMIPDLPHRDEGKQYRKDMADQSKDAVAALNRALQTLSDAKMSVRDRTAIREAVEKAKQEITGNADFVMQCFDEHVETRMEKAKIEINAYLTQVVTAAGLTALQSQEPPLILEDGDEQS